LPRRSSPPGSTTPSRLAEGGLPLPRYGRYKPRVPRHTNDTLVGQNGRFGDLPDVH
jgi:hypothetical protein